MVWGYQQQRQSVTVYLSRNTREVTHQIRGTTNQGFCTLKLAALRERFVVAFQLCALLPEQLPQVFKTHIAQVSHLCDDAPRKPCLAFHHCHFPNCTFPLHSFDTSLGILLGSVKIITCPLDALGWNQGNSSAGVNPAHWFITSPGHSFSCRSMCLHWATCILHWRSQVNSLTPEISVRSPDLV